MDEARAYIVQLYSMSTDDKAAAVKMTEAQVRAIKWFIDWAQIDAIVGLPDDVQAVDLTRDDV